MELKELYEKTIELFDAKDAEELKNHLMDASNDDEKKKAFCQLVNDDLSKDWLQMVYQYYLADRKEKKQDYTPKSIAQLMGRLAGDADVCVDLCAGSGALTIQKWMQKPDQKFELYELDENVIPFLLFNLSIRNISADVFRADVLQDEIYDAWEVKKGEQFAKVTHLQPAL
jgi:type I restriction-modification system DNA methylase subunit